MGRYQSRVLITEHRIKLLDNVVYELVIHIYQKIVFWGLSFGHIHIYIYMFLGTIDQVSDHL